MISASPDLPIKLPGRRRTERISVKANDRKAHSEPLSATLLERHVRPADEFAQGHVPGAVNIPLRELEGRLDELAPEREIVAYCRGPWCVLAFEAVARLRARGFEARRLEAGLPEWRAAGLPTATGA